MELTWQEAETTLVNRLADEAFSERQSVASDSITVSSVVISHWYLPSTSRAMTAS